MDDPSNILVVSGTDTEIGKTWVGAALARRFSRRGLDVRAIKPVESGTDELDDPERDGVVLAEAAEQESPRRALTELTRPLAPPEAADIDGVELTPETWFEHIESEASAADFVLVEGAGGLLSPLTWEMTARDVAERLGAPVLVVAPNELGVLNHTLMTLEVLDASETEALGVVFSRARDGDESTEKNPRTLRRVAPHRRIATVPKVEGWSDAVDEVGEVVTWIDDVLEIPL